MYFLIKKLFDDDNFFYLYGNCFVSNYKVYYLTCKNCLKFQVFGNPVLTKQVLKTSKSVIFLSREPPAFILLNLGLFWWGLCLKRRSLLFFI